MITTRPRGAVENSASELTNARAGLGWFGDRFFASSGFTLEDGRYGVPFADEFHMAHGVHAGPGPAETEIDLASRRRVGRFDMGLRNLANTVIEGVRVALNVIDWKHDELEVEDGIENIGTRFTNRTYIMRADVDQRQTDRLSGRFGAWAQFRDFEAVGVEALAPRTDQTSFAAFAYEEVDFRRTRLQFGGRVEQNDYRTAGRSVPDAPADDHGHSHGLEVPDARDRQFLGASASVGLHTDVGAGSAFVANLTHSHRAPALEELYNFGPHVGNLAFEVGNPTLDAETTLGLDVSFRHQAGRVRSNLNAYVYSIDNFIFGDRTGEVEDNLPVWYFIQGDSRFVGFDAKSSVQLGGNAWATLGIGYVDADPDHDRRAAAAHPAVARDHEPRRSLRRIHAESATGVRGAAGQRVPGRDGDERLLRRQPAGVLRLAAAARGAHPVVHGLQPDERALSQPHLVHQGSGPRDGTRSQGELLGAVGPNTEPLLGAGPETPSLRGVSGRQEAGLPEGRAACGPSTRTAARRTPSPGGRPARYLQSMPLPLRQSSPALHRALLAVLVFLSGAASLVYEVLWLKELGLLFGSTAYAASTTLAVFFLGLAVGGAVFGRLSPRLRSPLRTYAWLELGIAASAVAYFLLLAIYFRLYGSLYDALADRPAAFNTARMALATLALLPPAALMGGTLPVLGQYLVRRPDELGRIGSFLYAVNTLGAATGAFLAGFVLPLALGFDRAYLLAMAVNVAVAVLAWRLAASDEQPGTSRRDLPADNGLHRSRGRAPRGRPAASPAADASCPAWLLATVACLSGAFALGLEVLWTRMFAQVLQNSVYTFSIILVVFLAALATGSAIANRLCRVRAAPGQVLWLLLTLSGLGVAVIPFGFHDLTGGLGTLVTGDGWLLYVFSIFANTALLLFVPAALLGSAFPYLLRAAEGSRGEPGAIIGRLNALNTGGAVIGSLTAGFVLLGSIGLWNSMRLFAFGYLVLALAACWNGWRTPGARLLPAAATIGGRGAARHAGRRLPPAGRQRRHGSRRAAARDLGRPPTASSPSSSVPGTGASR